jgi:hypothetical protein
MMYEHVDSSTPNRGILMIPSTIAVVSSLANVTFPMLISLASIYHINEEIENIRPLYSLLHILLQ